MIRTTHRFNVIALAALTAAALALAAPALLVAGSDTKATAAIDKPAPDFDLKGIDGKTYDLTEYAGKYVVLEWNNFDCPFVKKHYNSDNMPALQKKYVEEGVVWLTICSSAPGKQGYYDDADLKKMTEASGWAGTAYLRDPTGVVGREYGAKTTPQMFVIDPKGVLVYAGAIDDKPSTDTADLKGATNYVQASLDAAMGGKPITTASTTSYGCSVKYAD
jgi:hypothetical protein